MNVSCFFFFAVEDEVIKKKMSTSRRVPSTRQRAAASSRPVPPRGVGHLYDTINIFHGRVGSVDTHGDEALT